MSRRLPTRRLRRSAAESIVCANSRRCSASHATSDWRRLVADALIDASGVRRSWLTAWSSAVRSWSASARCAATAASACSRRDCRASTRFDRNVRSTRWSSADSWAPRRTTTLVPSSMRSQRSPSVRVGRRIVAGAGVDDPPVVTVGEQRDALQGEGGPQLVEQLGQRFGSPIRMPLVRASAPASARAWSASRLRRRTRSTRTLAPTAAATKIAMAMTFSGSLMVNVWIGATKNQLTSREAATAATTPTSTPPRTAMATVATRNRSRSVASVMASLPAAASTAVSSGSPTTARIHAAIRRRGGGARRRRRRSDRPERRVLVLVALRDHVDVEAVGPAARSSRPRSRGAARASGCAGSRRSPPAWPSRSGRSRRAPTATWSPTISR